MLRERLKIKENGYPVIAKICDFLCINLVILSFSLIVPEHIHDITISFSLFFSIVFLLFGEYTGLYCFHVKSLRPKEFLLLGSTVLLSFAFMELSRIFFSFFTASHLLGTWENDTFLTLVWIYIIPISSVLVLRLTILQWFKHRVIRIAIVGLTQTGLEIEHELLKEFAEDEIDLAFYDDNDNAKGSSRKLKGNINELLEKALKGQIDEIYIALPMVELEKIRHSLSMMSDTTVDVFIVPDMYNYSSYLTGVRIIGNMQAICILGSPFDNGWAMVKRAEDLILGSIIVLLIIPLMAICAIGIKLTSRGPVIFKQDRYGLKGQKITVYKFRSMRVMENAEVVTQATKNDPRVTHFGTFLRSKSLDELPQFINVLQGRMSIVGPRPHAVAHNEQYRKLVQDYMIRHKVKPGITGLAQVNGYRGEVDTLDKMEKRVEYDIEYIQNWSLWLDLKIIFKTIFKGFSGENAY